jgi:HEAT repeat protein
MMKSLLAAAVVAACTIGAVVFVRKSAASYPDYGDINARLYDPTPATRQAAGTEMFTKADLASTRALLSVAREGDPNVLSNLNFALLQTSNKQSVEWLTSEALTYPERWVRYYAVRILWREQGKDALPRLLPLLADNYWQVQIAILDVLAESGELSQACDALGAASAPGKNWEVRSRAIRLLGLANSAPAARALLDKALANTNGAADTEAERAVEEALSGMTDADALKLVAEGLAGTDLVRKLLAVKVLGRAKSADAVAKLKEIAGDASAATPLRIAAIRSLVVAGGEDGVAFAIKALDGGEAAIRLEAAYGLSEATLSPAQKDAVKALAAKEQDWRVKQALQIAAGER